MPNQHVADRLIGIQQILMGVHRASATMSNTTSGQERQTVIEQFLPQALPSAYRFGTGDATDASGARSGQLDVVVEFPFMPSLPLGSSNPSRLYLAEGVAAVIEVKSNIASKWQQALGTATKLAPLKRTYGMNMSFGNNVPINRIPLFVVAYTGWSKLETVQKNLKSTNDIQGILVIDEGLFASADNFGGMWAHSVWGLWELLCCLHMATSAAFAAETQPFRYVL